MDKGLRTYSKEDMQEVLCLAVAKYKQMQDNKEVGLPMFTTPIKCTGCDQHVTLVLPKI